MVRAATLGLVDFEAARLFDPAWQRKLRLQLDYLHLDNVRQVRELRLRLHFALLGSKLSDEGFNKVVERCQDDVLEMTNLLQPWASTTKEDAERRQVAHIKKRWESRWGDMDSPEMKAKIDEVVAAFDRMRELEPAPDELASRFGVFNRQTQEAIEGIKKLGR